MGIRDKVNKTDSDQAIADLKQLSMLDIEAQYIDASDDARDAWAEVEEVSLYLEATDIRPTYCTDCESAEFGEDPSMTELENAFTNTIKKWAGIVKGKIEKLIAKIKKWFDKIGDKIDKKFWADKADKAFEHASTCTKTMTMKDWKWDVKTGSDLESEIDSLTNKCEAAVDKVDTGRTAVDDQDRDKATGKKAGYEFKNDPKKAKGDDDTSLPGEGGKVDARLAAIFVNSEKLSKTKEIKLKDIKQSDVETIFENARADRNVMQKAEKDLTKLRKTLDKIATKDFGTAGQASIKAFKKYLSNTISCCSKGASLVMERRSNIVGIVNNLYAWYGEKEAKDKD